LTPVEGALAAAGRIEPLPRRVVHGHAEQGQHGGEHGLELAVEGEDLGVNLLAHHPRVVARLDVEVSLEQVDDGQIGRALAVGGRAALEEQPALRAAGMSELPAQARFAHTGLAHHGHHLPVPGLRQVERLLELIQLDVTAHEGGQAPRGRGVEPGAHGARPEELEYFHRIRESLDGEGAARLHLDVSLGELPGARREENRPRLGHLLEARGQMRGLSHRGVIHAQIAADGPHHHLARVEPHADPRRDVVGAHHLARVAFQRFLHAEGGIAGPHRVILVGHRRAEERHDAVAHHLVDRALVAMHGFDHELQHRIEEPLRLLGIAVGEKLQRSPEVGEEYGDLLALAFEGALGGEDLLREMPRRVRLGREKALGADERGRALSAEAMVGRIGGAARRAHGGHRRPALSAEVGARGIVGLAPGTVHPAVSIAACEGREEKSLMMDGTSVTIRDTSD
jgi:hypothetical protein